jgi:hypothetical protein
MLTSYTGLENEGVTTVAMIATCKTSGLSFYYSLFRRTAMNPIKGGPHKHHLMFTM